MTKSARRNLLAAIGVALPMLSVQAEAAPFFQGLGFLSGDNFSAAFDVSGDGSVVVGRSSSSTGDQAFRWTLASGMVSLGVPNGIAIGTSRDGSVVVGTAAGQAFRWSEDGGVQYLSGSQAWGVSQDGTVVVGIAHVVGSTAFRWTEGSGTVNLGTLLGGSQSSAYDVSADGSVVVGQSDSIAGTRAFRWTEADGMVSLGVLPGGAASIAYGISADGSVVVGLSGNEAFRWTQADGMVGLGFLSGGSWSDAWDVSADGSVVVGRSSSSTGDQAFRWTAADGMRSIAEILMNDFGISTAGWELLYAYGVSDNGEFIVGVGRNPDRQIEAWVAYLPLRGGVGQTPVPEPASLTVLGMGLLGLGLAARRRRVGMSSALRRSLGSED